MFFKKSKGLEGIYEEKEAEESFRNRINQFLMKIYKVFPLKNQEYLIIYHEKIWNLALVTFEFYSKSYSSKIMSRFITASIDLISVTICFAIVNDFFKHEIPKDLLALLYSYFGVKYIYSYYLDKKDIYQFEKQQKIITEKLDYLQIGIVNEYIQEEANDN
jgi:cadmium resistance protein CadD (predicted permease)